MTDLSETTATGTPRPRDPQTIAWPARARARHRGLEALAPHVIVLFGATGDLAKRKLLPGLGFLQQSPLAPDVRIVGTAMEDISTDEFRTLARSAIESFGTHQLYDEAWDEFAEQLSYVPQGAGPGGSHHAVKAAEALLGRRRTAAALPLGAPARRPGRDRDAARRRARRERTRDHGEAVRQRPRRARSRSNDFVHQTFHESQIFRIDHFLGKEAAQNILAFRFANGLFEPIWNRNFIDHVQIDIPETLGLDQRANFYESTGAYKDMVVTHLMQVMAFVAMEPPTALEPRAISEEKNKVFRSMLPIHASDVVRGQYSGYRDENGVAPDSDTETFIALKVGIDNWRWAGTPFYLRTGKKLAEGMRIISIAFKEAPRTMFPSGSGVGHTARTT